MGKDQEKRDCHDMQELINRFYNRQKLKVEGNWFLMERNKDIFIEKLDREDKDHFIKNGYKLTPVLIFRK